jgi:hypothetical protein
MVKRKSTFQLKIKLIGLMLTIALTSCNFPGLSPTEPISEVPTPTSAPTETQVPEDQPTTEPATAVAPESTPTQTPPPELPGRCRPFPDQVYVPAADGWLDNQLWVKCGGSSEPILTRSPVEGLFWDYSNQTGKLLYGTEYSPEPNDPDVWVGDYTLWVYDFRTDTSTKWLPGGVLDARWAPEVNNEGQQRLAVIMADGMVGLISGPEQVTELANIKRYDREMEACCISWSPKGDQLAYIKNGTLYVIPTLPREPRMMAENAIGHAVWVLDQQLLIFPSSIIKVARVDGSGPFIPNIPDGNRVWATPESRVFWDSESRTLVFDEVHQTGVEYAITWVYSFSEDFETVIEQYSMKRKDSSYLISWYDQGQSVITSHGEVISIRPAPDQISLESVIDRIYQGRYMLWLEDEPYSQISVSLRAQIEDSVGNRNSILDLDEGLKIKITGQSIAQGYGFLAYKIQILED